MLGNNFLALFLFLFCVFCTDHAKAEGLLQGLKENEYTDPFTAPTYPGATLSIRKFSETGGVLPLSGYMQSFGPEITAYQAPLAAGQYEIGMQVPDGYRAFYSLCTNCVDHPSTSFEEYGGLNVSPLIVTIIDGQYLDLHWKFLPQNFVQVPVPPTPGSYQNLSEDESTFDLQNLSQYLTCNVAGVPNPLPPTHTQLFNKAANAWAEVGVNAAIGGIGVAFNLINPKYPNSPLQIIDARSAGGAAWQSTIGIVNPQEENGARPIAHYNQAAGNSAEVWGFGSEMINGPDIGLVQKNFVPLFSNDVESAIGTGIDKLYSPCFHSGLRFGNGHMAITPSYPVAEKQNVLRLTSTYTFRALGTQNWGPGSADEQAIYMLRAAARAGDLRVYFLGQDNKTVLGPVRPYNAFETNPYPNYEKKQLIMYNCPPDPTKACALKTQPTSFAVLVWNVMGQDIAMAIHGTNQLPAREVTNQFSGVINLRQAILCQNPNDDSCGNLQWHTVFSLPPQGTFENGQEITQTIEYDIGSVAQIFALLKREYSY